LKLNGNSLVHDYQFGSVFFNNSVQFHGLDQFSHLINLNIRFELAFYIFFKGTNNNITVIYFIVMFGIVSFNFLKVSYSSVWNHSV
jgi:hypothetical protein